MNVPKIKSADSAHTGIFVKCCQVFSMFRVWAWVQDYGYAWAWVWGYAWAWVTNITDTSSTVYILTPLKCRLFDTWNWELQVLACWIKTGLCSVWRPSALGDRFMSQDSMEWETGNDIEPSWRPWIPVAATKSACSVNRNCDVDVPQHRMWKYTRLPLFLPIATVRWE